MAHAVGVPDAALVTLVAVGNGSANAVSSQFAGLGADTLTVSQGRGFSGATLASDLGLTPSSAHGTVIRIGNSSVVVVGVLEPQGGVGFLSPDDNALIPMQTMLGRLVGSNATISQIRVQAAPGLVSTFGSAVEANMRAAHNLSTTQADDFLVINPTTVVAAQKQSSTDFTLLITAIAAISLIVGGIGVANVMLVAVRERTREIGVRRALGARRRHIIVQFLTEATVLSAVGGGIGVVLGLGFAYLLPSISSQQTQVSYWAALLAFVASALVGIVAGVGPANQAAALEPASALRYE